MGHAGVTLLQTDDTAFMDRTLDEMVDLCYENLRTKIEALFQMGEYDWRKFNYTAFIDNFEDSGEKLVAIYLVNSIVYMSEIFAKPHFCKKLTVWYRMLRSLMRLSLSQFLAEVR